MTRPDLFALVPPDSAMLDPDGAFTLHISNQSYAISPVDIQVQIDGEVVVWERFNVGSQHSWRTFILNLSPGKHQLKVSSRLGDATLTEDFQVRGKHWAVIDYWYYPRSRGGAGLTPRSFSFTLSDEPVYFQ